MSVSRAFPVSIGAVLALLSVATPAAAGQERRATAAAQPAQLSSFRTDFNRILDHYDAVFQKLGDARGLELMAAARESLGATSDDQLAKLLEAATVPDLSGAVRAAARLESLTPTRSLQALVGPATPDFPNAPPILSECDGIAHTPGFTFGALVAWQVLRAAFIAVDRACQQVLVVAGEGGNTALACIAPAVVVDAAGIPFELATFCSGEEDTAIAQGSYARLQHIHDDIEAARVQIITEMRNLSCDIERLLHTPEGQRRSAIAECSSQPFFPYDFPIHPLPR